MAITTHRKLTDNVVSATDAKNSFGEVLARAREEPMFIESRGHAAAVMISMELFEEYELARKEKVRADALAELRELQRDAERRNADLTPDQADAIIEDIVHDAVGRMVAEGKIRYDE